MTICMGITQSYQGLVVCRFFLGLFEAGFVPGAGSNALLLTSLADKEQVVYI